MALSGVHHGATLALAVVQLHSDHDLRLLEPGFPVGADEEENEELIGVHACWTRRPRCLL